MSTDGLEVDTEKAIELILDFSWVDGGHHKTWVFDQVLRVLMGPVRYKDFIKTTEDVDEEWLTGTPP